MAEREATPVWIHALAWEPTEGVLDAGLGADEVPILESPDIAEHLRGERLMDLPKRDVVEAQVMPCEEPRDRGGGGHEEPFLENVDGRDLKIDEPRVWEAVRQAREARAVCDPDGGRTVGQGRAISGGERATSALPVEHRLQLRKLVE